MPAELISLAEAREQVLAAVRPLAPEEVPLPETLGRVLAEDIASPHDLPPFDASAMDGFAVVAGPAAELAVVGESRAGRPASRSLGRGEAIRISTGAQIPEGADAVIPVERVAESDGRVQDERDATVAALERALAAADVVCVSGGVSVGPHDHVKGALASVGAEERFWGIALKPGKPTWFGLAGPILVFGLPGNPVSAMVTFHLLVRPALRALAGAGPADVRAQAVLDASVRKSAAREQAVRCRLRAAGDGWHVEPTKEQGSHVLTSMLGAGALALIPPGDGVVESGERVAVELLARGTLSS